MMGRIDMYGWISFILIKDVIYQGGVDYNKDIIELYIYYDKFLVDGSKGFYFNKNCIL